MNNPDTKLNYVIQTAVEEIETALVRAGKEAGVSVARDGMISVSQGGITFVASTINGVAKIPTTALRNGVDFGFVYYASPSKSIPTGFHMLRIRADVREVGKLGATAELVDCNGKVVARAEGEVEVASLSVLEDSCPIPMIMAQVAFERDVEPGLESQANLLLGVWCKKNGMHGDGFTFQALA